MELPQARPQAGRQPTHDFLSLYSHLTAQQDPRPPTQGNYLRTHDFLQPLERTRTPAPAKEEATVVQKPRRPAKARISCVEQVLPGGIGTYSISHISFSNNQITPKPEAIMQPQPMAMDRNDETYVHKSKSFMEMIKSAKECPQDDEFDNEEEAFVLKKEPSNTPPPGDLRVKVDGKSHNQKRSTPRSKHSATEQRRRSKINDRFQMLREIIPHARGDQKRDKASFLLEVIEYIHFLQEKVNKYEGSYQGWNQEPEKLTPWRNIQRTAESYADRSRDANSGASPSPKLLFASKIDEKNIAIFPAIPGSAQNLESGTSTANTIKPMDQHLGITNKAMPISIPSQPNFFTPAQSGGIAPQLTRRLVSDAENNTRQPSVQCQTYSYASDMLKQKDLTIEGGDISISSVCSKGLLDTLTQALQGSGVDLSQASISVQIELGKQGNIRPATATPSVKDDHEILCSKQGVVRPRVSGVEDTDKAAKKTKTCRKANLTVS